MLWILLKKQFAEVFRTSFYNPKNNKKRSVFGTILFFIAYILIIVGVLGGMFTFIALALCESFHSANVDWLYFVIMSCMSIVIGAFGSVFSTYNSLYLAKDNDLILSMPIPVKDILASKLINVFIIGAVYSCMASIPMALVYCIITKATFLVDLCNLILVIDISVFVLAISCILGWCVAKLSLKLRNKSFITVLLSLIFIAAYYLFYFKAENIIQDLILNAAEYGEQVKGYAYVLYLIGKAGEGNVLHVIIINFALFALLLAVWIVLKRTFLGITTASNNSYKKKDYAKHTKLKSPFGAMLEKELLKFTSSANYMLNCGLGIIFILVFGVALILKGSSFVETLELAFDGDKNPIYIITCAILCFCASMNDMSAPSISLEAKNIWIYKSLPVHPKDVLIAKTSLHIILTGIPIIFSSTCAVITVKPPYVIGLLLYLLPLSYVTFTAFFGSFIGIKLPSMSWTNEIYPIKQSGAVAISLFGDMIISGLFCGIYFVSKMFLHINTEVYLGLGVFFFSLLSFGFFKWTGKKGSILFEEL